jgi:EmrB/QacA subfamily drug resistance transporter
MDVGRTRPFWPLAEFSPMDRRRVVLWSMTVANAMVLVDQTAVPLALPNVIGDFHVGSQLVQWVLTASLLPIAGLLVLGGRLGDLVGRRRIFTIGCVLFAGASALGGAAPNFAILLVCRALQGIGGALMLPNSIAIVSGAFPAAERGSALGLLGGVAAIAGALGPTIGGALTGAFSWRAVLFVNVPLAVCAVLATRRVVPPDPAAEESPQVDIRGTALLTVAIIGLIFGLTQSQDWGWGSPAVIAALVLSVAAAVAFVRVERRVANPLMSFPLLTRHRNYLAATASQLIAGMAEMGLGLLFPLILILNLKMSPELAGLALIPTTVPMVVVAPLAGRWYDRSGGRQPLVLGFGLLAVSGVVLSIGIDHNSYAALLPGLLVYGVALALVLTTNDPVTLDTIAEPDHGQAAGVSATAEQFGGALGVASLYLVFHTSYVHRLVSSISASKLPDFTATQAAHFKSSIIAAEQTGLKPNAFDPTLKHYLPLARSASDHGYLVAMLIVAALAVIGLVIVATLVRAPTYAVEAARPGEELEHGADASA